MLNSLELWWGIGQVKQAKQTRPGPSAINEDVTMDYICNSTGDGATALHTGVSGHARPRLDLH
jgi:hypothetical protein